MFTPKILANEEPARAIEPPDLQFLYHCRRSRSGYDTRAGIMQVCAWMYIFKNCAVKDRVGFRVVYGMPLGVGELRSGGRHG